MSVRVEHGDCREVIKSLAEASVHACVTDPPYSLVSIQKRFGRSSEADVYKNAELRKTFNQGVSPHARAARGFMGQQWDTGETAHDPAFWAEVYRAMKPGAHLVAFGGTRSHHRQWCAIEDAGFEVRDTIAWMFGSGFPKSHNIGNGWGTALKPAFEPIILARKPLSGTVAATVLEHGTGALNIDGCRIESGGEHMRGTVTTNETRNTFGKQAASFVATDSPLGRWPANLCHDGSEEVLAAFPAVHDGGGKDSRGNTHVAFSMDAARTAKRDDIHAGHGNAFGSAARFFYSAKADADDRCDSKHPTVKPVALVRWLVRLITPPGGLVLDPFAGSGTTGVACIREGFDCILIEREPQYVADIKHRLAKLSGFDTPLLAGAAT